MDQFNTVAPFLSDPGFQFLLLNQPSPYRYLIAFCGEQLVM